MAAGLVPVVILKHNKNLLDLTKMQVGTNLLIHSALVKLGTRCYTASMNRKLIGRFSALAGGIRIKLGWGS